jgi:hypothetical protein
VWGEAFDQSWKTGEACNQGPNWGLHGNDPTPTTREPKLIITKLQKLYTSTYGTKTLPNVKPSSPQSNSVQLALDLARNGSRPTAFPADAVEHLFAVGLDGPDRIPIPTQADAFPDGGRHRDKLTGDAGRPLDFGSEARTKAPPAIGQGIPADYAWVAPFLDSARARGRIT